MTSAIYIHLLPQAGSKFRHLAKGSPLYVSTLFHLDTANRFARKLTMNPMKTFDPSLPAMVRDRLNDRTFAWSPDSEAAYKQYAREVEPGVISFDGLLLDGWQPI